MIRRLAIFLAAACAVQTAAAQGGPDAEAIYAELFNASPAERQAKLEEGARKEGRLSIINTTRPQSPVQAQMFMKRYPFIQLDALNDLGTSDAGERFYAEETAGRHLTDVVTGGPSDMSPALKAGMVARYPTPVTDRVLPMYESFKDPERRWVPFFWAEHGISYNSNLLTAAQAPKQWMDLCNPAFKGSVSFDPAERLFLSGLQMMMGEEGATQFLKCMGANQPIIQRGHEQRMMLMLSGDHMVQGDNYFFSGVREKRAHGAPFEMVLTAPVIGVPSVAIINKRTTRPYAAALFVDWLLSEEDQTFLSSELRGVVTIKHPFIPETATIVPYKDPPEDVVQRLFSQWRASMEPNRR